MRARRKLETTLHAASGESRFYICYVKTPRTKVSMKSAAKGRRRRYARRDKSYARFVSHAFTRVDILRYAHHA
jgi:hypothetical protein